MGKIICRLKFFVGNNFRHLEKNSSLLADKVFTDKVSPKSVLFSVKREKVKYGIN